MASGLIALLDDVALIAKLAASSIDDVAAAAGRAGAKTAGVVIDDAAVTPNYVTGFSPERELPMIWRIAKGSIRNKLFFLMPGFLLLAAFAPWALTPLLMLGGTYLCFESAEKIAERLGFHPKAHGEEAVGEDPQVREDRMVSGAIRTDVILSAEILAIALGTIPEQTLPAKALILTLVSLGVTVGVYGAVGLIVKMDNIGLKLSAGRTHAGRALGRGLVKGMPLLLETLSIVGIAAMAWVGGGILIHGLEQIGLGTIPHAVHQIAAASGNGMPLLQGVVAWLINAVLSAILGLIVGIAAAFAVSIFRRLRK